MDSPEPIPAALPQSETISPGEDTSRAVQVDPFYPSFSNAPQTTTRIDNSNLGPFVGNLSSPTSEKSAVNETTSQHHPTNSDDDPTKPIRSPLSVRLSGSGRRETGRLNTVSTEMRQVDNGLSWIVPTEEKVSKVFFNLN